MKDLTEAELIEMEQRASRLTEALDVDPDEMSRNSLQGRFETVSYIAEAVAQDVAELCEHLRAVSIEAQKAENAA
jgi:hypothetical protein